MLPSESAEELPRGGTEPAHELHTDICNRRTMNADRREDQREDQVEKDEALRYKSWGIQKLREMLVTFAEAPNNSIFEWACSRKSLSRRT